MTTTLSPLPALSPDTHAEGNNESTQDHNGEPLGHKCVYEKVPTDGKDYYAENQRPFFPARWQDHPTSP